MRPGDVAAFLGRADADEPGELFHIHFIGGPGCCPNFALSVLICLRKYLGYLLLKWSKCPNSDSTRPREFVICRII